MRTIHFDYTLLPLATAYEIVDDFGDLVEWERVAGVLQWPGAAAWSAASAFDDSMEIH
jgi:hypothetical protein